MHKTNGAPKDELDHCQGNPRITTLFYFPLQDGGCTCPGDLAKAFGAGADFVMAGGMFAGHDECGGDVIEKNGRKLKLFYGMASCTAMKKHAGGVAEYRYAKYVELNYQQCHR